MPKATQKDSADEQARKHIVKYFDEHANNATNLRLWTSSGADKQKVALDKADVLPVYGDLSQEVLGR